MDIIAPFSRHIITPLWAAWERSSYLRLSREMLQTQFDSLETIVSRQEASLRAIIAYAYKTTPFWRKRLETFGFDPSDILHLADLQKLPLLTKADLRLYGDEMLSTDYRKDELYKHSTSGSTGVPVVVYRDEFSSQMGHAAVLRADEWSGWRLGERKALIWGNPKIRTDWRGRLRRAIRIRDYLYLDTLKMNETNIRTFVNGLSRKPPSMLFGHAHSIYLVASFIEAKCPNIQIRPKGILSTCMVLHNFEREKIEEVFQCKVTNRYGCEEVSLIASECERHEGLHVNSDCLHVEIIDDQGKACPPGKPGRIIVTNLVNRAMPTIRYEVGDMASWAEKPCSCGRGLPLLERIEGRVADYVTTPQREMISGISLTENFAVLVPGVAQLQIIQEEVDRFVFRIVKGADFGPTSLESIRSLVTERFGFEVRYECKFVDRIAPEPSGKYRFCISKVENTFTGTESPVSTEGGCEKALDDSSMI